MSKCQNCGAAIRPEDISCEACNVNGRTPPSRKDSPAEAKQKVAPFIRTVEIEKKIKARTFERNVVSEAAGRGAAWGLGAGVLGGIFMYLIPHGRTRAYPGWLEAESVPLIVGFLCAVVGATLAVLYSSLLRPVWTAIFRDPEEFERQYGTPPGLLPRPGGGTKRRRARTATNSGESADPHVQEDGN